MQKHQLTELSVDEISLVDRPSNRGAWVALRKRDKRTEEPMPEAKRKWLDRVRADFEEIGKRDSSARKQQIIARVRKRAIKKAAETGGSPELIESRLWEELYSAPRLPLDYDLNPIQKRGSTWAPTEAEARIEELALKIQKRDGITYPAAVSKALDQSPELYAQYCREKERGAVFPGCSEEPLYKSAGFLSRPQQDEIRKRRASKDLSRGHPGTAGGGPNYRPVGDPLEDERADEAEDEAEDPSEAKRKVRADGDTAGAHRVRGLKRKRKASDEGGAARIRGKQDDVANQDDEDEGECPACGGPVDDDDNFCPNCGASLAGARA